VFCAEALCKKKMSATKIPSRFFISLDVIIYVPRRKQCLADWKFSQGSFIGELPAQIRRVLRALHVCAWTKLMQQKSIAAASNFSEENFGKILIQRSWHFCAG
jgi:hypothetical protein